MNKVFPQKVYYQIKEKLGEGLTSEVHKAYRVDEKAWTQQLVALKIIKSKKNIQILKTEFEKLTQVHSKYCVQVKAWENLPQGSALVLEYIDGVTLFELHQNKLLTEELVNEVISQMNLGLMALHREQVVHGDLNLKNVLVNSDGLVKLIDFGFHSSETECWLTPIFAAKSLLEGGEATEQTDRESLDKIFKYLSANSPVAGGAEALSFKFSGTRAVRRRTLGRIVRGLSGRRALTTQVVKKVPTARRLSSQMTLAVLLPVFLVLLLTPTSGVKPPEFGLFEVSSDKWVGFSINSLPIMYSPIVGKKMRSGRYQLSWVTSAGRGSQQLKITGDEIFKLKPYQDNL